MEQRRPQICRYYSVSGSCKFGSSCKFAHIERQERKSFSGRPESAANGSASKTMEWNSLIKVNSIDDVVSSLASMGIKDSSNYSPKDAWKKDTTEVTSKGVCNNWADNGYCVRDRCMFLHPLSRDETRIFNELARLGLQGRMKIISCLNEEDLQTLRKVIPTRRKTVVLSKEDFGRSAKYVLEIDSKFFEDLTGKKVVDKFYEKLRSIETIPAISTFQKQMSCLRTFVDTHAKKSEFRKNLHRFNVMHILNHSHHNNEYELKAEAEIDENTEVVVKMQDMKNLFLVLLGHSVTLRAVKIK